MTEIELALSTVQAELDRLIAIQRKVKRHSDSEFEDIAFNEGCDEGIESLEKLQEFLTEES